jgi:hypothetical protein
MDLPKAPKWIAELQQETGLSEEPVYLGSHMWGCVCRITPTIAASILMNRNKNNRKKKKNTIERYKNDIEEGRWGLSHQAIAFDRSGELTDGQNRLEAVRQAGKPIPCLVVYGVVEKSRILIDTGVSRSARDAAIFAGVDANNLVLGTVKKVYNGLSDMQSPISPSHTLELLDTYKDGIDFVWEHLRMKRPYTSSAAVRGAIVRAYYYYASKAERERLAHFCQILYDGQYHNVPKDKAPYLLHERLGKEKFHGRPKESYWLTERAIKAFMEEEKLQQLRIPKTISKSGSARISSSVQEIFPLTNTREREEEEEELAEVA